MYELNYKGTKIEIGVKLGDQNRNWQSNVALTRDSQRLRLTINIQIELLGPILQRFIKLGIKFVN